MGVLLSLLYRIYFSFCWDQKLCTRPKQKVPLMKTHWRQPTQKNLGVHPNPKEEIKSSSIIIRIYHVAICLLPTRSNLSLLYIIFPSGLVLPFFLFKFLRFQVALHRSKLGLKQMSTHCWRVMVMDPQRRAKDVNTNHSNSTRWPFNSYIIYDIWGGGFKYFLCSPLSTNRYIFLYCYPWKSRTKQRMIFRMIYVKDVRFLSRGKVWSTWTSCSGG